MSLSLLNDMSKDLLQPKDQLDYLIRSAPHRYSVYQIPKRSGYGMRTIAQPAKEVKGLQYWALENVFPHLPVHRSATAYIRGRNIRHNAEIHALNSYMLKLDFKDFFPSIKGDDFINLLRNAQHCEYDEPDLQRLMRIVFWCRDRNAPLELSIGAPSSPYVSNAIMYDFDAKVYDLCTELGVAYGRYADDLAFSMREKTLRGIVLDYVVQVISDLRFPRLQINERKTVFGSKAHRRMLTGLIISNTGVVSLGRERKRRIRAQIHRFVSSGLSDQKRSKLRGTLAFARDVEPDFVERMERRYGKQVLREI